MAEAHKDLNYLKQPQTCKSITSILRTNVRAAKSLGHDYIHQLGRIFMDVLNVYKVYSSEISNIVASSGPQATHTTLVRAMRSVKKETLLLLQTFIEKSEDDQVVTQNFIPPLLEAVLIDYKNNIPDARDPEVLSLMSVIIDKFKVKNIYALHTKKQKKNSTFLTKKTKGWDDRKDTTHIGSCIRVHIANDNAKLRGLSSLSAQLL